MKKIWMFSVRQTICKYEESIDLEQQGVMTLLAFVCFGSISFTPEATISTITRAVHVLSLELTSRTANSQWF